MFNFIKKLFKKHQYTLEEIQSLRVKEDSFGLEEKFKQLKQEFRTLLSLLSYPVRNNPFLNAIIEQEIKFINSLIDKYTAIINEKTEIAILKGNNKMYDDDYMDLGGKEYQLLCKVNEEFFNLSMAVSDIVNRQNNKKTFKI